MVKTESPRDISYDSREVIPNVWQILLNLSKMFNAIIILSRYDVYLKYKRSVLGLGWSFLNPLLISSVIYFVFGQLFNGYMPQKRGYFGYVLSGILLQSLFVSGISNTAMIMRSQAVTFLKLRVPFYVQAFSASISQVAHFSIGILGLVPLLAFYGIRPTLKILIIPVFLFFAVLLFAGLGCLFSGLYIKFDDASFLLGALVMVLSYLSPIFYPIEILNDKMRLIVELNPITAWVQTFRFLVFENQPLSLHYIFVCTFSSLFSFLLGLEYLRRSWSKNAMYL